MCEAESRGDIHQVGERLGLHLSHHLASVCLHRDLADAEFATDLFIQQARDHQRHDLPFAAAEQCVTFPKRAYLGLVIKCGLAAQGKSASEIAAAVGSTPASVRVKCCRWQQARQIAARSLLIHLDDGDYAALRRKAADMQKSAVELTGELLRAVIRSDIYEAVTTARSER